MVDLTRSLESVVHFANHQYQRTRKTSSRKYESGCEIIGQLSSTTINSGVLFFQISPATDKFVRQWIHNHIQFRISNRIWQDEQALSFY